MNLPTLNQWLDALAERDELARKKLDRLFSTITQVAAAKTKEREKRICTVNF